MTAPLEPLRMLATLRSNGTRFVLVGGLANAVRGGPIDTDDVDICIPHDDENYRRLALALRQLAAVPVGEDAASRSSYETSWGPLDLIELGEEFDAFDARATEEDLGGGVRCKVSSPEDMIRLTRLSGDLASVVNLVSLQDAPAGEAGPGAARAPAVHEDEYGPTREERGSGWLNRMWSTFEDIDGFMSRVVYGDDNARVR